MATRLSDPDDHTNWRSPGPRPPVELVEFVVNEVRVIDISETIARARDRRERAAALRDERIRQHELARAQRELQQAQDRVKALSAKKG